MVITYFLSLPLSFLPPVIAKSMALLSTGNPILERRDSDRDQQEKCCQGSPNEGEAGTLELLDSLTFGAENGAVSLEEGLNLLDGVDCSYFGGISPQYSPFSEYSTSSDSGYAGSITSPFPDSRQFAENLVAQGQPGESSSRADEDKTVCKFQLEKNRKNAVAARQNRIKKKKYVEELEKEHSALKTENVILKTRCREFQTKAQKLQAEVHYLKSVLANDSVLASLISNIPQVPDVKLAGSFRKRPNEENAAENYKKVKIQATSAGICLHVSKDVVSLEFCQHCSKQAAES